MGGSKEGSSKNIKDYEKIFAPKNIGGEGESTQIHGNLNDSGNKDQIQVKKFGDTPGEMVDLGDVLNNYKKDAYEKLDTKEIPVNMKEIVKEYFSELDQ